MMTDGIKFRAAGLSLSKKIPAQGIQPEGRDAFYLHFVT
jgi:hypothetical protein